MDSPKTITVSREALRAELLDLELRLTDKLAAKGELVAVVARVTALEKDLRSLDRHVLVDSGPIASEVKDLDGRVDNIEKGEFTPAFTQQVAAIIAAAFTARATQGWTARERWLGLLLALATIGSFVITAVVATRKW